MEETILLIEDDENIARYVKFKLEKKGYDVHHKNNGIDRLEAVDTLDPDLVVMDMMMPGLDGREVTERIKEQELLDPRRIIILSGKEENEEIKALFDLGIYDYLQKPFDFDNLLIRIERALTVLRSET
ncbi:MAG: response regulator transcription factor [Balneolaceae bacterium]|nr:response regulator transcription factor [Balneolaceae bacterium]